MIYNTKTSVEDIILQSVQEAKLQAQKQIGGPAKKFESSGNDVLGGGLGLDKFTPQIGT